MIRAYIAIGSNIDPHNNVRRVITYFARTGELSSTSTFYRTRPSHGEGPPFVNGVIAVNPVEPDAAAFLDRNRALERDLGRLRGADKNSPRPIDLDVVAWPEQWKDRLPSEEIERYDFVAWPLAELNGRVMTRGGRRVIDVARGMPPSGMMPLMEFTRELRRIAHRARMGRPVDPQGHPLRASSMHA